MVQYYIKNYMWTIVYLKIMYFSYIEHMTGTPQQKFRLDTQISEVWSKLALCNFKIFLKLKQDL